MPRGLAYPLWSPDGSRLIATDLNERKSPVFVLGDDVVTEPSMTLPPPDPATAFWAWSWSTDDRIAGFAGLPNVIWVYAPGTGRYTRIAPGNWPAWMADERRLGYHDGGRPMLADTETRQTRDVFALPGEVVAQPRLSRNNRFFHFTHATTGADL